VITLTRSNTDSQPQEIAQQLSPAMREALADMDRLGFIVGHRGTLRALQRRGLCGHPRYDFAQVSDLGRAVHAELTRP
jgi:hypothetical protein